MKSYDPNQPRVPAGHSQGGQWTNKNSWSPNASVADKAARKGAGLPPKETSQSDYISVAEWGVLYDGKVLKAELSDDRKGHDNLGGQYSWSRIREKFQVRGLYGYMNNFDTGENFNALVFYVISDRGRLDEVALFEQYYNKILNKIGGRDYSPTVYYTHDFFDYYLYDPRRPPKW